MLQSLLVAQTQLRGPVLSPPCATKVGRTQLQAGKGQALVLCNTQTMSVTRCSMDRHSSIVLWLTLSVTLFYGAGRQPAL